MYMFYNVTMKKTLTIIIPIYGKPIDIVERTINSALTFKSEFKEEIEVFCLYRNNDKYNFDNLVNKYNFDYLKKFTNGEKRTFKIDNAIINANSKYTIILDSDDTLESDKAKSLISDLKNIDSDFIVNKSFYLINVNKQNNITKKIPRKTRWANWNAIYNTAIMKRNAGYCLDILNLDDVFKNLITGISGKISFINIPFYDYYIYESDINNSVSKNDNAYDVIIQFNNLIEKGFFNKYYLKKNDKNIRELFRWLLTRVVTYELWNTNLKYSDFKNIWELLIFRDRLKYKILFILNKYIVDYFK